MPVSTADLADAEGPNASVDYGGAKQISALQREGGQFAYGGQGQQGGAPPGGPPSGGYAIPPQAGSAPSPPVQGPPSPGASGWKADQYFEKQRVGKPPAQDWMDEIRLMATHRSAGPALRAMLRQINEAQQR